MERRVNNNIVKRKSKRTEEKGVGGVGNHHEV